MGWTHWYVLADKEIWYPDNINYDGPACYELGIKGKWKQVIKVINVTYVGKTYNLKVRMGQYGANGSHLGKYVEKYLKHGYTLYFRYYPTRNESEANSMEKERLQKYGLERYPWNTKF